MRRLLIACDHPSLHRGFATVGRHIARGLHATGRWRVQMIGRYPSAQAAGPEPYEVLDADANEDVADEGDARFRGLLHATVGDDPPGAERAVLLSIGSARDQQSVVDRLAETGLGPRVRLVAYMPVNYAPLPPAAARLLERFELVVPFTLFAARALREVCRGGAPAVSAPIPHGVDSRTFRPPDPDERRRLRLRRFGLDDSGFLVGFFGRNTAHKRPDLAVRIFSTFALGAWSRCLACSGVTPWELDPLDDSRNEPRACGQCGSARLSSATARQGSRLYLHTERLSPAERAWSGGWDMARLVERSGVGDHVHIAPSLRVGEGVSGVELAALMGACDAHLLPSEGGGWELTVLETGACGVPNVINDAGAPPEYAAPFSVLVPPAARLLGPTGMRHFMDEGRAVDALVRLAGDPDVRGSLGGQGLAVAAAHAWPRVTEAWDCLLSDTSTAGPQPTGALS